jgi:hypothetical protein
MELKSKDNKIKGTILKPMCESISKDKEVRTIIPQKSTGGGKTDIGRNL